MDVMSSGQFVMDSSRHWRRYFNPEWQFLGYVEENGRALCVLCGQTLVYRSSSVKRHFHCKHESNFSSEAEKREVILHAISYFNRFKDRNDTATWYQEIRGVNGVQKGNTTLMGCDKAFATECSFTLARFIAKRGKPFTDGEYIKEAFISCSETLFSDLPNRALIMSRLKCIPASPKTMEGRITEMAANIRRERATSLVESPAYSVALVLSREDVSPDIDSGGRLSIAIRFCDNDSIFEELCYTTSFDSEPSSQEVLSFVKKSFEENEISPSKVFSFVTDNAPVFVDADCGFLALFEEDLGRTIVKYHCLLDWNRLTYDMSEGNLNTVVNAAGRIINFVVSNSTAIETRFQPYVDEIKRTPVSSIALIGEGQVLQIFVRCLDVVKSFVFNSFGEKIFPELKDSVWLNFLMYLVDVVGHLSELQQSLEGQDGTVLDVFEAWRGFIAKIKLMILDISSGTFSYFPHLKECHTRYNVALGECLKYTEVLMHEFSERLDNLYAYEQLLPFMIDPQGFEVSQIDLSLFPMIFVEGFELQFVAFKTSKSIQVKFTELKRNLKKEGVNRGAQILKCWNSVPDKFISVKRIAFTLISAFGSVILNKDIRKVINTPNNPLCSRLTPKNSDACAQLKLTNYVPDIKKLCMRKQGQGSH